MKKFICAILSLMLFVACSEEITDSSVQIGGDESVTPSITLNQTSINFDEHAYTQEITFNSAMAWTAELINERADGWCSISPTSGSAGSGRINVNVTNNSTTDDRTASVIIKSGAISRTVRITQKQQDALTVTASSFEVEGTKGKIYIEVKANIDFEYTINGSAAEWITPIETRAMKTTTLGFNIAENKTMQRREGTITIHSGAFSETVTVYQKDGGEAILLSQSEYVVSDAGEDIAVEVTSNVDVEIEMPDVDWITRNVSRAVSTNTYYFTVAENTTYDQREAYITFKNTAKNITERVKVTQVQRDAIVLAANQYNVSSDGEQIEIELGHNVDFKYEIVGDWISHIETRAFQTNYLVFEIAPNTSYDGREGSVIFTANDGSLTQVAQIFQAQKDAIIISDNDIVVSDASQQVSFEVQSNIDFSVINPEVDWLHPIVTRGLTTYTLTYTVDENTTYDSREAQITVTNNDTNITQTITITQAQRDAIVLAKSEYEMEQDGGALDFDIQTNVEVSVTISKDAQSWITQVQTRGLETRTLFFDISAYEGDDMREGTITITGGGATQTVTVRQLSWQNLEDNKIFYTSSDGSVIEPNEDAYWGERTTIISNTYENGQGVITFSRDLTHIADNAFQGNKQLTSVTIPNKVTTIGSNVFDGCKNLAEVTIGESVKTIGSNAFLYCGKLESITIPDSVTNIGSGAFQDCYALASVTFGRGLETIGDSAFAVCNSLTNITIPDNVKWLGNNAFNSCENLAKVNIGDGVETIGSEAFRNCEKLAEINLGSGLETIEWGAFANNSSLTRITIPNNVKKIGNNAFYFCDALTSITIPNSVKTIGSEAFRNCEKLAEVNIGESVETIGGYAFSECDALTSIVIPNSVTYIETHAFENCSNLAEVTIGESVETIDSAAFQECDALTSITIPNSVKTIEGWAFFGCSNLAKVTIGDSVETIGDSAFYECDALTSITIPNSVKTIETQAFFSCSNLAEVTIGECVETIGWVAFSECDALTSITIPNSVKTIYGYAFSGCSNLAEINIGTGVETIGEGAFQSSEALTSINIPGNVKTINNNAFSSCYNLAEITLNEGLETIGSNAFGWCHTLKSITIPQSVKEITGNPVAYSNGIEAFYGKFASEDNSTLIVNNEIVAIANHGDLTSYTIPNGITKIADYAFAEWYNLQTITIPDSVTEIGNSAFENCGNLQTINIPESVTSIGNHAFLHCGNLQTINIPEGITTIKYSTFNGCSNLKEITLPNSLTKIEEWAFQWSGLTEITIPDSVTEIGFGAFAGCNNLTSFSGKFASADNRCLIINDELVAFTSAGLTEYTLPNGITTIKRYSCAYLANEQLTTITISNSVTTIENSAFWDANYITEITISENITNIGNDAFGECDKLSKVYVKATTPPHLDWYVFNNTDENLTIYVPRESVDAYKTEASWSGYDYAHLIQGYDF